GYLVDFADFRNPSVAYLEWRLRRRGHSAQIHNVEERVPKGFDAAYSFDVVEHVSDPFAFLRELEDRASLVLVNLLEFDQNEHDLHHRLPVEDLLAYVARRQLLSYQFLHGSSHVVAYRPQLVGPLQHARNRLLM